MTHLYEAFDPSRAAGQSSRSASPRPAGLLALQRMVGNVGVTRLLTAQRCGPVPCDCPPEERAAREGELAGTAPTVSRITLQREVVCPPGVDPAEGTGCYETADAPAPAVASGIAPMTPIQTPLGPVSPPSGPVDTPLGPVEPPSGPIETPLGPVGGRPPPAVEPPVTPVEPVPVEPPVGVGPGAGGGLLTTLGVGAGALLAGAAAGLATLLWSSRTAEPWQDTLNPITGGPWADEAEYRRVQQMTPEQIEAARNRRRGPAPDTGPPIDPRTGEPHEPQDPCDLTPLKSCEGGMTFDAAKAQVSALPGFQGAVTSGRQPVLDDDCWTDGRARSRTDALAQGAHHQTWNTPSGDKVATIKCCPCCVRGGTGATGQHCTVN
jgi:hypothetical protein